MATDTIYGLVGQALNRASVERIYQLKRRQSQKPFIILIGDLKDLEQFDLALSNILLSKLQEYWPGPVSVILQRDIEGLGYLHRGGKTLVFRLPDKPSLRRLLRQSGPLVAPSANPEGQAPVATISQARGYFSDSVDFYKPGRVTGRASKLIKIQDESISILRN